MVWGRGPNLFFGMCLAFPASFVEKTILSPLNCLGIMNDSFSKTLKTDNTVRNYHVKNEGKMVKSMEAQYYNRQYKI